jgi:hypothetical protein
MVRMAKTGIITGIIITTTIITVRTIRATTTRMFSTADKITDRPIIRTFITIRMFSMVTIRTVDRITGTTAPMVLRTPIFQTPAA